MFFAYSRVPDESGANESVFFLVFHDFTDVGIFPVPGDETDETSCFPPDLCPVSSGGVGRNKAYFGITGMGEKEESCREFHEFEGKSLTDGAAGWERRRGQACTGMEGSEGKS